MIPMTIQTKATTAPLPWELRTAADASVPISIDPSARTTTDHGGRAAGLTWPPGLRCAGGALRCAAGALYCAGGTCGAGWPPYCASRASTRLSISSPIRSTSPSATASSYPGPSSRCAAPAAAISSRACWSTKTRYIAIMPSGERAAGTGFSGGLGLLAVAVELERLGRQGGAPEDQVGRLLGHHHDRRVDVAVGDVRHRGGVHHPQALEAVHRHAGRVDDRPVAGAHLGRAGGMQRGLRVRGHPVEDLLVGPDVRPG